MPNIIAYLALLGWPLVTRALFKRFNLQDAICWSIVGGYLLLPTGMSLDAPLLPAYDKALAPALAVFVICMMGNGGNASQPGRRRTLAPPPAEVQPLSGWRPRLWIGMLLLALTVFTPNGTALANTDPIRVTDSYVLRGTSYYDGLSFTLQALVAVLPLLIGRRYLHDEEGHRRLVFAIFMGGVAYVIPILLEVRLSPQLHSTIYGYFPSDWRQQKRFDGFRPVVFLQHGLWVAIYMSMAAAAGLAAIRNIRRSGTQPPAKYPLFFLAMAVSLILCKSFGAVALLLLFLPALLLLSPRGIIMFCAVFGTLVLTYPAARGIGAVPVEKTIAMAERLSAERAESLAFRVRNEELLLEHANQRPWFGWGSWGRSLVFDEKGNKETIQDGLWIIIIGQHGWLGYIGTFGLLVGPVLLLAMRHSREVSLATAGLTVVGTINMLDMLPNSSLTPISWLIAGALWGRVEALRQPQTAAEEAPQRRRGAAAGSRRPPRHAEPAPQQDQPPAAEPVRHDGPVRPPRLTRGAPAHGSAPARPRIHPHKF